MTFRRFDFYDDDGNFGVEIKTQKNIWLILGVLLYFGVKLPHRVWKLAEIARKHVIEPAEPDPGYVLLVFLFGTVLIVMFLVAVIWLLWSLYGREVVEIRRDQLVVKHDLFNFGPQKFYWLHKISDMHVKFRKNPMDSILRGGNIEFNYDGKPKRFGWTLAQEDAQAIVDTMKPHLREKVIQLVR